MIFLWRRGLTLIELLISLFIVSIIMMLFVSMLQTILNYRRYSDIHQELQNAYFAMDYMQGEFRRASEVRPISDFSLSGDSNKKYFGFVLIRKILPDKLTNETVGCKYHYTVYYYKDGCIFRNATTKSSELGLDHLHGLGGYNLLCENITSIDGTEYLPSLRLIRLRFTMEYLGVHQFLERDFFIRREEP